MRESRVLKRMIAGFSLVSEKHDVSLLREFVSFIAAQENKKLKDLKRHFLNVFTLIFVCL